MNSSASIILFIQEKSVLILNHHIILQKMTLKLVGELTGSTAVNNIYLGMLAEGLPNNLFCCGYNMKMGLQ